MTISRKLGLMVSVSSIALGMIAITSVPARAFDEVNWTWDATVTEIVTKDVNIDIDIAPTGMVMLEDLQIQIGDVTATSTVTGVHNIQPTDGGSAGGTQIVDLGTLAFTGNYNEASGAVTGMATAPALPGESFLTGTVNPADPFGVTMNFDLGEIEVTSEPGEAGLPLDALTELPEVVSSATAVANNTSITADTAVQLHEQQVVVGIDTTFGEDGEPSLDDLTLAEVSATSTVSDILNASVDSLATAVGNNLSVEIAAAGPDRLFMADVIQLSAANITATSDVSGVEVSNYLNLGMLDRPLVSSVATAVGNNKSISVNAPSVDVGTAP